MRVPNADWISSDREGLTICDATSAAFAQPLDWPKLDVVTYSWQKVLGGEAAHGMLILSPRAVKRLQTYAPPWPVPTFLRIAREGELDEALFEGETVTAPSMLCVEDYIDTLQWAKSLGGLKALVARSDANAKIIADWIARTPWIEFLARNPDTRSNTSVCLKFVDPMIKGMSNDAQVTFANSMASLLEREGVAYDIGQHRDAPAGLRIWCGATVESDDIAALTLWLDWAFEQAKDQLKVGTMHPFVSAAGLIA